MDDLKRKIKDSTSKPGVYLFKDNFENIIYIGKAKNLKKRVSSYFSKLKIGGFDFVSEIADLEYFQCSDEKEAMLLESELIKKLQPKYNIEWKDDKNYFFVGFSEDKPSRIFLTHQLDKGSDFIGPLVKGRELKSMLRSLRKILPYRTCRTLPKKPCLYHQLNLCYAPCIKKDKRNERIIEILRVLLEIYSGKQKRIECYDVSNLSGTLATGSMVVFKRKKDYRMFKIKTVQGQNDVKSLKEILHRRLKHKEWPYPDLIILDGGKGQLKAARNIPFPVLALAKSEKRSGKLFSLFSKQFIWLDQLPENVRNIFLQIRDEAHRFAIGYNKKRRIKNLDIQKRRTAVSP